MRPRIRRNSFVLAALIVALASSRPQAAGQARHEVSRDFSRSVPLNAGQELAIDHSNGNIDVRVQPGRDAHIQAKIRVSAESETEASQFSQQIAIEVRERPTGVLVQTVYPPTDRLSGRRNISFAVDYTITMPDSAVLDVHNRFGNVIVAGLRRAVTIVNGNGRVGATDLHGGGRIENSFGAVEVARVTGTLTLTNGNGAVTVTDVNGPATIADRFGNVTIHGIRGPLSVTSTNGAVEVGDARAGATVSNSFGPVKISEIDGDTKVTNGNGNIDARALRGAAELTTSFGAISATDIAKTLRIVAPNSRITVTRAGGSVYVKGAFGPVDVRDIGADATVEATNSTLTLENIRGRVTSSTSFATTRLGTVTGEVKVVSQNGNVIVADIGGVADVKTSFGSVQADRVGALTVDNGNGGIRAAAIKGSVNLKTTFGAVSVKDVGGRVDVRNQNGTIEVSVPPSRPCADVTLTTSFAPIRLGLPEGIGFTVAARTSFGRINSELPVTASGVLSGTALGGSIAGGGCAVTLANTNGDIVITKAVR
jgi:hypothetical protein